MIKISGTNGFMITLFIAWNLYAYTPIPNSPLANNERPRIFINEASLPKIVARSLGSHKDMYTIIKSRADEHFTGEPNVGFAYQRYHEKAALLSLVGLLERERGNTSNPYISRAFYYAEYVMDQNDPWTLTRSKASRIRGLTGGLAIIYDWLYADLPGDLKTRMHNYLLDVYKGLHNIERPSGSGQRRRSVYGSMYWNEWGAHPWFTIPLYGDGEGDEDLINDALSAAKNEVDNFMVPAIQMLGGALQGGWGYSLAGDVSAVFPTLWAWQSATGNNVFTETFALKEFSKFFLYSSKPNGSLIKLHDTKDTYSDPQYPYGTQSGGRALGRAVLILPMHIYKDGYAKYIVDKQDFRPSGNNSIYGWRNLVFYDNEVAELSPGTLPLVHFFPEFGLLSGRSSWDTSALFYTFRNGDQFGNHSDAKQNSFTIYNHGSPLAINDGNYPSGASGALSTKSYLRRTLSSNSVLVFDPDESFYNFKASANDGGQKYGDLGGGANGGYAGGYGATDYNRIDFDQSEYNTADNYFEDGVNYTYIKGDATRGYSSKVKHFIREFVHIKPSYFVVFDRVGSTNKDFKKKWLLHSITEPLLNGNEDFSCTASIGESACQGNTAAGISISSNSREAVITNGNGRLFLKTLLPANPVYRKLGGPGYMFWVDDADQDIPPKNYTPAVTGGWRIEVKPLLPQEDDLFLHVLEASDLAKTTMTSAVIKNSIAGDKMVGVQVSASEEWIILFAEGLGDVQNVTYIVTSNSNVNHLISDVTLGDYTIKKDGSVWLSNSSSNAGTIYFADNPGGTAQYEITIVPDSTRTGIIPLPASPLKLRLLQNMPNPFNSGTRIQYHLPSKSHVRFTIFNIQGRVIRSLINQEQSAGNKSIYWNGLDRRGVAIPAGIYVYKLKTRHRVLNRKMILE